MAQRLLKALRRVHNQRRDSRCQRVGRWKVPAGARAADLDYQFDCQTIAPRVPGNVALQVAANLAFASKVPKSERSAMT